MADGSNVADWITAVSTAATAAAAIGAGMIAWVTLRRDVRSALPIVEFRFDWMDQQFGDYVRLLLTVRNQIYETLSLDSVLARKPSGMLISHISTFNRATGMFGVIAGTSAKVIVEVEISPAGTTSGMLSSSAPMRVDAYQGEFYLSPPPDWDGGRVKLDVRVSSRAHTIRDKRITIKSMIPPRPTKKIDESARRAG